MYYRMEACDDDSYPHFGWEGIFSYLDPWDTGSFENRLKVPDVIQKGSRNTRSWFTETGWRKFKMHLLNACARHCREWNGVPVNIRIITTDAIPERDIIEADDCQAVESFSGKDNVYDFPVMIQEERIGDHQ